MKLDDAINLDDLRRMARRRLPKVAFDYIDGGVEDEACRARNIAAFQDIRLMPRGLVDVSRRAQATTVFGQRFASPFGIAPTGAAGLFRRDADRILGEAAAEADIPFIMSGGSSVSMEAMAGVAPDNAWFQLYAARDTAIADDMVRRVADTGLKVLVVTIDVPFHARREHDIRNNFAKLIGNWWQPALHLPPRLLLEALTHPGWILDYIRQGGMPMNEVWRPYAPAGASAAGVMSLAASQMPTPSQSWSDIERYRRLFPGKLVIKGVLRPADAVRAAESGCDGVIVSNHGGRQFDRAPASIEALPGVVAAAGDRLTVMLDSGVRRGSDVLTALCLGARLVFLGRPMLFGAVAGATPGVLKAIDIVRTEIDLAMAQLGCTDVEQLGDDFLPAGARDHRIERPRAVCA
jgi:(S)-mandelate dehydrogenase